MVRPPGAEGAERCPRLYPEFAKGQAEPSVGISPSAVCLSPSTLPTSSQCASRLSTHSITPSASASSLSGTSRPSVLRGLEIDHQHGPSLPLRRRPCGQFTHVQPAAEWAARPWADSRWRRVRRAIAVESAGTGLRERGCFALMGDDLRKMPPGRGLPYCRSCAGHQSCNHFPAPSPSLRTRARDLAGSRPPGARRC
jgi:hypothetical protein